MLDARGLTLKKNDNVCYIYRHFNYAYMMYGVVSSFDKSYVCVKLEHNGIIVRKRSSSLTKIPKIRKVGNTNE